MNIIMRFLANGLILLFIDWLLDSITINSYGIALLAMFILSIMNMLVKPILQLITLPITILTFGLFSFVINAFTFLITSYVVSGFVIHTYWGALLGSFLLTIIQSLIVKKEQEKSSVDMLTIFILPVTISITPFDISWAISPIFANPNQLYSLIFHKHKEN